MINTRFNKTRVLTLRLTEQDILLINKIALFLEMNSSDLLRMYIRKNNSYYGRMMLQATDLTKPLGYDKDFLKYGYTPQIDKDKIE
jgi:hypothetical protein